MSGTLYSVLMNIEAEMNTAEVILSNVEFRSKSDLLLTVVVPESEMNTAAVILINFEFCYESDFLVTGMGASAHLQKVLLVSRKIVI